MFKRGNCDIIFFHEKGSKKVVEEKLDTKSIRSVEYKDYFEYLKVKDIIKEEQPDIIISAAAISDYIVDKTEGKISSDSDELVIRLKKGEKVIQSFRELAPDAYIVGFKCLVSPTEEEKYNALKKQMPYVNMSIYNDLAKLRAGETGREMVYLVGEKRIMSDKDVAIPDLVKEILIEAHVAKAFRTIKGR